MDYPQLGGLVATKGGLVFSSHPDGTVVALDSDNLKNYGHSKLMQVLMPPITFSAGGKQYVAILAGLGGRMANWFIGSTPGMEKVQPGQTLYVFGL